MTPCHFYKKALFKAVCPVEYEVSNLQFSFILDEVIGVFQVFQIPSALRIKIIHSKDRESATILQFT